MTIASVMTLFFVAFSAPIDGSDDVAPDLDAPLPALEGEVPVDDDDTEQEPLPAVTPTGDAPPPIDTLPVVLPTDDTPVLPPADDKPVDGESDVARPWPWSTTIGSVAGAAIPTVILGGSGTVIGGCGLFLISSGVAQGGCAGIVLVLYGVVVAIIAVPVLVFAALLTPIATIIGALVGGAVSERFAWPSATGALLGFVPAFAAVAAVAAAYVLAMTNGSTTGAQQQFAGNAIVASLALAMVSVLLTGPAAVGGAALGELFADGANAIDDDGFVETTPVDESEAIPPAASSDAPPVVDPPASAPSSTGADAPPPLLGPDMRY